MITLSFLPVGCCSLNRVAMMYALTLNSEIDFVSRKKELQKSKIIVT